MRPFLSIIKVFSNICVQNAPQEHTSPGLTPGTGGLVSSVQDCTRPLPLAVVLYSRYDIARNLPAIYISSGKVPFLYHWVPGVGQHPGPSGTEMRLYHYLNQYLVFKCKCKEGYEFKSGVCKVMDCPHLLPPDNGYFIRNECNNVFNAACGIRCNSGYQVSSNFS